VGGVGVGDGVVVGGGVVGGGGGGDDGGESIPFDGNFSSDRPYGGDLPDFSGGRSSVNGKTNVDDSMFRVGK
jgi:hypothetical protein